MDIQKLKSGIDGLDQLLFGGLPQGRAYLVSGEPGTGKTIFSLQYCLAGIKEGQKAMFVTIDEKPSHLIANAKALGWDLSEYLESGALQILDLTSYFESPKRDGKSEIDVNRIVEDVLGYVRANQVSRLAIDPIAPLIFSESATLDVVDYIKRIIFALETDGSCTTLLSSYVPVGSDKLSQHGIEEFAASGIILLRLAKVNHKYIRTIRIRKMRGTRADLSEYSFEILPNRGVVVRQPV